MKKFIISFIALLSVFISLYFAYFNGAYINISKANEPKTFTAVENKNILVDYGNGLEVFDIKGVNIGVGIPSYYAVEHSIEKDTYLKWFQFISDMGANVIRVYTIQCAEFYDAFYEFNSSSEKPLYMLHGVWIDDIVQNSHYSALDSEYIDEFIADTKATIDIIHGRRNFRLSSDIVPQHYRKDISQWVLGYILGVEWEDSMVAYTNNRDADKAGYLGKYLCTSENATAFETMLCIVGDKAIEYETQKYNTQRLIAFSNWCTTDPLDYNDNIRLSYSKYAKVETEHILSTEQFISGQFASYHVYPYYPDYYIINDDLTPYIDENGKINTYRSYLTDLNNAHTMPVIISEFGLPSSRGMAARDFSGQGRSQGGISEHEQAEGIISCYTDIIKSGCSGGIVFSWQDEWFKRTWNTMETTDLDKTPYWSNYQTNEQFFGLLSFDPGEKESVCYTDGNTEEWEENDIVFQGNDISLSMKYDEKFVYFRVNCKHYDFEKDTIYIPIDTIQTSGSNYCKNYNIKFSNEADFVIKIHGKNDSRITVQKRYDSFRATSLFDISGKSAFDDIPDRNSNEFNGIYLLEQSSFDNAHNGTEIDYLSYYETGILKYANGNPNSSDFNSLSDYYCKNNDIEIRIPWQLLNFSNPSEMEILDDLYDNYGVSYMKINKLYAGVSKNTSEAERIDMYEVALNGWNEKVTYHERFKEAYYALKEIWNEQ